MDDRYDVVVVGGGIAGLVAAATAARGGATVAVLEARRAGGRARTTVHDGFRFNQGGHALYLGGALMRVCRSFGLDPAGGVPALPGAAVWHDGERHPLARTVRDVMRSRLLGWRSKVIAGRLFGEMDGGDAAAWAGRSLTELLDAHRAPADLRAFVEMLARLSTYANAPDLMSAEAVILQYRQARLGVRYLDGGWEQMIEGLAGVARSAGARILDHRAALAVGPDAGDWVVTTPDGDVAARAIVLAVGPPAEAARLVGEDLGWTAAAGPAARAACLDLGTVELGEVPLLLSVDDPYYLSTHAPPARLAPEGHYVIQAARYLRPGEQFGRVDAEAGLWAHAARAGVRRASAVTHRYLHDMVVAGGMPVASRGGFAGRPSVAVLERPGLYLAGDWVGTEGLIGDAAAASGHAAGLAAGAAVRERAA